MREEKREGREKGERRVGDGKRGDRAERRERKVMCFFGGVTGGVAVTSPSSYVLMTG